MGALVLRSSSARERKKMRCDTFDARGVVTSSRGTGDAKGEYKGFASLFGGLRASEKSGEKPLALGACGGCGGGSGGGRYDGRLDEVKMRSFYVRKKGR